MKTDIKALRAKLDMTQKELGTAIGVNQSTIARLENGQEPSGPVARLLEQLASGKFHPSQQAAE